MKSAAKVDSLMQEWMGIDPGCYIKMTTPPYDGIHHIDMHMKLLDEETLLVGAFPQGVSDGPQPKQNLQAIMNGQVNAFGEPYEVVRTPMPPSTGGGYAPSAPYRTYANNVFINKTILVPPTARNTTPRACESCGSSCRDIAWWASIATAGD